MILTVVPWRLIHPGGVNEAVKNLLHQHGRALGVPTVLLVADWDAVSLSLCEPGPDWTCCRLRIPGPFGSPHAVRGLLGYVVDVPRVFREIGALVKERGITTVNVHYPTSGALTFGLVRALGSCAVRLTVSFHGSDLERATAARGPERIAWAGLIRASDATTTVSEAMQRRLVDAYPAASGKCWIIPNGIDVELLREEERAWRAAGGEPLSIEGRFILSVGNYIDIKGQDTLLRAFARARARLSDARLVIAGRQGPMLPALKALASDLGVSDRVTFLIDQPHPRLMELYRRADMFVLSSIREGFPIVLLEAGAMRLPVIATRVGGVAELIDSGVNGLLLEPGDWGVMADSMERLWLDRSLAAALGRRLQRKILEGFSWHRSARRYREVLGVPDRQPVAASGGA